MALYGATFALPAPDECYASLFWYTQRWRPVVFGLLVAIASILLLSGCLLLLQIRQNTIRCMITRMTASHMIYYNAISVFSIVSIISLDSNRDNYLPNLGTPDPLFLYYHLC